MTTLAVAAAASTLSVGGAYAQDSDDGLPSGVVCRLDDWPCHQFPKPTPPNGGGIAGYEVITVETITLPGQASTGRTGFCPSGKRVVSGGLMPATSAVGSDLQVNWSGPNADGTSWDVAFANTGDDAQTLVFRIICANVAS
ncbi:hypothetical protein ACFYYI_34625 [Streptomyces sp. NPDC002387]|uniref:hypothetical protein n=1 Tax=unclassified Streptomyces TaxID=2593676 RepID=UPI0036433805